MHKKIFAALLMTGWISLFADPLFMAFPQRNLSYYNPVNIVCQDTARCTVQKSPNELKVIVREKGCTLESLVLGICGRVRIRHSSSYTLAFEIKANRRAEIVAVCQEANGNHSMCGKTSAREITAGTSWKSVSFSFTPDRDLDTSLRLPGISLGHLEPGTEISIRYVVFYENEQKPKPGNRRWYRFWR